jgi:hypothetical protein
MFSAATVVEKNMATRLAATKKYFCVRIDLLFILIFFTCMSLAGTRSRNLSPDGNGTPQFGG